MTWKPIPWILALVTGASAVGQVLDLDRESDLPAPEVSVLEDIAAAMIRELPSGLAAPDLESDAGVIESANATLRRLIAELANRGRGSSPGDRIAGLAAIRLANSMDSIEKRLQRLTVPGAFTGSPPLRLDEEARRRGLDRLSIFAQSALETLRRLDTGTVDACDDALSIVFAPVLDAVSIMERRTPASRWPTNTEIGTGGSFLGPPTLPPLPEGGDVEEIDRILRTSTTAGGRRIHRSFRETAARIDALDPATASTGLARAAFGELDLSGTDDDRALAIEWLTAVARGCEAIQEVAASTARRDVDVEAFERLLGTTMQAGPGQAGLDALDRQASLLRLVIAGGDTNFVTVDRDLRVAARAVQQRHRRLVRSTASTLVRLGSDPAALADPTLIGGLQALEGSIADIERLQAANTLTARITSIRPGAAREFRQRVRAWAMMLGEDSTRENGARAIDRISADLARFTPMPSEAWLASERPTVAERTGGRGPDLLARLESTRRAWADELFHGEVDGPARRELLRLARLGDLLESLDAILGDAPNSIAEGLATCDRWGGWFVAPERFRWTARNLVPSLGVACASAVEGDAERLERDLVRLEKASPPANVVAWLSKAVGPLVEDLPGGSIGAISAVAIPPERDAWGRRHRPALASICIAFAEIAAAQQRGDDETASAIAAWVISACEEILDEVGTAASDASAPE